MGYFFLPVWMTCTWIAGYYVHSGRTSGKKMRNSIRENYVIFFLLTAHQSFRPIIPVAEHLPDDFALSHSYTLVSASALGNVMPLVMFRGLFKFSTVRFPPLEPCFKMCKLSLVYGDLPTAELEEFLRVSLSVLENAKLSFFSRNYSPGKKINLKALEKKQYKVFSLFGFIFLGSNSGE